MAKPAPGKTAREKALSPTSRQAPFLGLSPRFFSYTPPRLSQCPAPLSWTLHEWLSLTVGSGCPMGLMLWAAPNSAPLHGLPTSSCLVPLSVSVNWAPARSFTLPGQKRRATGIVFIPPQEAHLSQMRGISPAPPPRPPQKSHRSEPATATAS